MRFCVLVALALLASCGSSGAECNGLIHCAAVGAGRITGSTLEAAKAAMAAAAAAANDAGRGFVDGLRDVLPHPGFAPGPAPGTIGVDPTIGVPTAGPYAPSAPSPSSSCPFYNVHADSVPVGSAVTDIGGFVTSADSSDECCFLCNYECLLWTFTGTYDSECGGPCCYIRNITTGDLSLAYSSGAVTGIAEVVNW